MESKLYEEMTISNINKNDELNILIREANTKNQNC